MASLYIDNDSDWWKDAIQKICIIADCVDVFWDSKSFSPRLKDSKKRGAEAKKEFQKHFCMMKDMDIQSEHIDAFTEIVRIWRRIFSGKERKYDPAWMRVLWGKFLRVPPNYEEEVKKIMIDYFRPPEHDGTKIRVKCESEVEPPTPYKLNFDDPHTVDAWGTNVNVEVSDVADTASNYCGHFIDLGGNQVVAPRSDPTKIDAIIMLVKTLELNKADKVQLIQSVLSLI